LSREVLSQPSDDAGELLHVEEAVAVAVIAKEDVGGALM